MMIPPLYTSDVPVGPNERTLGFSGSLQWYKNVLIWRCTLPSPNEIYLSLYCLKEIGALVQHHPHHILHNLYPMYEPHWRLPFALNLISQHKFDVVKLISFSMKNSFEVTRVTLLEMSLENIFHAVSSLKYIILYKWSLKKGPFFTSLKVFFAF